MHWLGGIDQQGTALGSNKSATIGARSLHQVNSLQSHMQQARESSGAISINQD